MTSQEKAPNKIYDMVYSMQDLHGMKSTIGPDTITLVRLTSAAPTFNNANVIRRTKAVNTRRKSSIDARRLMRIHENHYHWLDIADKIYLNGNDFIRDTFPEHIKDRIISMDNIAGNLNGKVSLRKHIPEKRAFLWHAGSGAIHKGLDLCLEVFARHPNWELYITGDFKREGDFLRAYEKELRLPNIHNHGWLVVSSDRFRKIVSDCIAFILPTCAESQSSAAVTCLSLGLYPIISRESGVDLPENCGLYLDSLTIADVEEKIEQLLSMNDADILEQISVIQQDALVRYSRERFRKVMTEHIERALEGH